MQREVSFLLQRLIIMHRQIRFQFMTVSEEEIRKHVDYCRNEKFVTYPIFVKNDASEDEAVQCHDGPFRKVYAGRARSGPGSREASRMNPLRRAEDA